jgi:hypothetical protein
MTKDTDGSNNQINIRSNNLLATKLSQSNSSTEGDLSVFKSHIQLKKKFNPVTGLREAVSDAEEDGKVKESIGRKAELLQVVNDDEEF